jgi:hypothetical protein
MNSVVEDARQAHEEVDLYEQALATIFLQPDTTVRRLPASTRSFGPCSSVGLSLYNKC